jgi:thiol-disulfide isomerase/thioredoxin
MRTSLMFKIFALGVVLLASQYIRASDKPFDSKRNAEQDLQDAEMQAAAEHKNIFVDFGGNWCAPCLELDQALKTDPNLAARLQRSFVVLHINVGALFPNKAAPTIRKQYPPFKTYPHVLILAPDGELLHDEIRGDFMTNDNGKGFSHEVLAQFLDRWAPKPIAGSSVKVH